MTTKAIMALKAAAKPTDPTAKRQCPVCLLSLVKSSVRQHLNSPLHIRNWITSVDVLGPHFPG
jgi:hypothetical protein